MTRNILLAALAAAPAIMNAGTCSVLNLKSPDGRNEVCFSKPGKELTYTVGVDGKSVILPSRAGLDVDNRVWEMALGKRDLAQPECWMDLLEVDSVTYHVPVDSTWRPLYGERSTVREIGRAHV